MDGKELKRRLREILDESSSGTWIDERTSYDYIWEAAQEFVSRTGLYVDTYRFETATDVADYALPAKFLGLYLRDSQKRFFVKYMTAGSEKNLLFKDYEEMKANDYYNTVDVRRGTCSYTDGMLRDTGQAFTDYDATSSSDGTYLVRVYQNDGTKRWAYLGTCPNTTSSPDYIIPYKNVTLEDRGWNGDAAGTISFYEIQKYSTAEPTHFSVKGRDTLYSQITGTCTKEKSASAGEVRLEDSAAVFLTTDYVSPGDHIHNTTDGSTGVVLEVESATQLKIALFGGTDNGCGSGDAYVIQPMGRMDMVLDPPPDTAYDLVEVSFVEMPDPVYSDYRSYKIPQRGMEACIKYAAWMYKYRDAEPDFGDSLYLLWDKGVREFDRRMNPAIKKQGFTVNFKKRR